MAEFCKQCSDDMFGPDVPCSLAGMISAPNSCEPVLCEGCGIPFGYPDDPENAGMVFGHFGFTTFVDKEGKCMWLLCPKHGHRLQPAVQGGSVKELQQQRLASIDPPPLILYTPSTVDPLDDIPF